MSRVGGGFHDLGKWMSMRFVLDIHVFARSRQNWRESFRSLGSLPTMKMVVSSANSTVESGGRASGKSFMKVEKRVGPRTEPCGTPDAANPRQK